MEISFKAQFKPPGHLLFSPQSLGIPPASNSRNIYLSVPFTGSHATLTFSGHRSCICAVSPPKKVANCIAITPGTVLGSPSYADSYRSTCDAGDLGLIPGLGRSPEEGNGNPLQYSCLGNSMDRGAWWATVPGVTNSWT